MHYPKGSKALLIIVFVYQYLPLVRLEHDGCVAIVTDDVSNCTSTSTAYLANRGTLAKHCDRFAERHANYSCNANSFCGHVFKISFFSQMLFTTTMKDSILNMLRRCCGACAQCRKVHELSTVSQLTPETINTSDIVFPVLGHISVNKIYGHYFIPIHKVPSSFYFTLKETGNAKMTKVIFACLKMWPLLIICVLMALIAGVVSWTMEMRKNASEFPKPFHIGVFEGFWWGFVSMTTVGYGDKVPKTIPGRIFAMIWILIGITVCSIFTASLTTEIINARSESDPELSGKKVGVLLHRMHDTTLVTQHGGIIHQINISKTTHGIKKMMDLLLEGKKIDGFVLNINTYYFFKHRKKKLVKIIKDKMEKTEKLLEGEQLYSGILMKTKQHYDYFLKYFQSNRLQLESCHDSRLNLQKTEDDEENVSLFSPKGSLFISFLYYSFGLLGIMICFGIVYEVRRNRRRLEERFGRNEGVLCNSLHHFKIGSCFKRSPHNQSEDKEEYDNFKADCPAKMCVSCEHPFTV